MKGKILILSSILGLAASSQALTFLSDRSMVGANDGISWGQFGPEFTDIPSVSNGFTDNGGLFQVLGPDGQTPIERVDQPSSWAGDFNDGDQLIWDQVPGGLTIRLAQSVNAIGLQLDPDAYGAFIGHIEAYDGLGNDLGGFDANGTVTNNDDGSALFLGVGSDRFNIAKIVITSTNDGSGLAVNQVSMQECVPEPASFAVLGLGALALIRRRRR